MAFRVVSIRRYPVKSMGGESLESATIDARGLSGDRWYAVVDDGRRLASGKNSRRFRRRDAVFDYAARTDRAGRVSVARGDRDWLVGGTELDAELSAAMDAPVRVEPEAEVPHQDAGSVSLVGTASLDWCREQWGVNADPRRLRVNVVIETQQPFVEDTWAGQVLDFGDAALRVTLPIPRCRMIDIDQDSARAEGRWLKHLGDERDLCLAVYADVVRTGTITTRGWGELR